MRYSIFARADRKNVFYCQIWSDELGRYLSARSTGKRTEREAQLVVLGWEQNGQPAPHKGRTRPVREAVALGTVLSQLRSMPLDVEAAEQILKVLRDRDLIDGGIVKASAGGELLTAYLSRFWDYDSSPYIKKRLAHGHRIGRRHAHDAMTAVKAHWTPYFKERRIGSITAKDLEDFGQYLYDQGKSAKTVSNILAAGIVPLRWAAKTKLLKADPTREQETFAGKGKERGILEPTEAAALFRVPWNDERARVGSLLAMTTGMRAGEVLALRPVDLGADRIVVTRSWSENDGIKSTKTGATPTVPLLPEVREQLLSLAATSPHGQGDDGFIFYDTRPERPMRITVLQRGLDDALVALSLPEAKDRLDPVKRKAALQEWRKRRVSYHGWRHYNASRLADLLGERTMALTGHLTKQVFARYSNHATEAQFLEAGEAARKVFANVVPFKRVG